MPVLTKLSIARNRRYRLLLASELYPQDNAASIVTELDDDEGWSAGNSTITSESDSPQAGSYEIKIVCNGSNNSSNGNFDLNTILTDGISYRLSIYLRHIGTGGAVRAQLSAGAGTPVTNLIAELTTPANDAYANYTIDFVHDTTSRRFLVVIENNVNFDGGAYVDALSIVSI
jgi:hypothetical protein